MQLMHLDSFLCVIIQDFDLGKCQAATHQKQVPAQSTPENPARRTLPASLAPSGVRLDAAPEPSLTRLMEDIGRLKADFLGSVRG